jgi:hypothetical protein
LDCKGKNYFSNKKAFIFFLAETIKQKALFAQKRRKTSPKSHFLTVKKH